MNTLPVKYYLSLFYPYTVHPSYNEHGIDGYVITFDDLPGCMTQVDVPSQIPNAAEEIRQLWLESEHESNEREIPMPFRGR